MAKTELRITEAQIKKAVSDLLTYEENQGHLLHFRLNAGSFILSNSDGSYRRRVQGTKAGTADFVVLQNMQFTVTQLYQDNFCQITFLEVKRLGGKQSKEQKEFETKVKEFHCRYYVVTNVEEVESILHL